MSKKRIAAWSGVAAVLLAALVLSAMPVFTAGEDKQKEPQAPAAEPAVAEATPEPVDESVAEPAATEPLSVRIAAAAKGFQVQFDAAQGVETVKTVEAGDAIVHAVRRYESGDGGGQSTFGLEALVVRPKTREAIAYPLYRVSNARMSGDEPFLATGDDQVLFVRQTETDERVVYDLAKLDVGTGEQTTVSEAFWTLDLRDPEQKDDFLISSDTAVRDGATELMLTSYKGRVAFIDVATGEARREVRRYPAYGDPGSTPPRTLVYPSPDQRRFVYQERDRASFKVVDADAESVLGTFDYGETKIMEPGIVWSPDSGSFYLETDTSPGPVQGMIFDNGTYVFATAIDFYDKYGLKLRTAQVPPSASERMNVYGWADGKRAWLEYFTPQANEGGTPLKADVSYKLYDVSTGQLTAYRTAGSAAELDSPAVVRRQVGYSYYRPTPYLLVDEGKKLVWPSPVDAQVVTDNEELYARQQAGDANELFRWDAAARTWQWIDADLGEDRDGNRVYSTPVVVPGEWLIYPRRYSDRIDYVSIPDEAAATEDALPVIPAAFAEPRGTSEWWANGTGTSVTRSDARALRARGTSRYGAIELRAEPGEAMLRNGGATEYHGDYRVTFAAGRGKTTELPLLKGQTPWQEESVATMSSYPFDGFDVLLYAPRGYRFGQGYDGGNRATLAYAVTKDGEAFPLTFDYDIAGAGRQQTAALPIDANVPVRADGGRLVVRSLADGSRELALTPNLAERTLTVTGVTDRKAEYDELYRIANKYAGLLEQGLGLEEGSHADRRVPDERVRGYFADEAWNNPGFAKLRDDFAESKADGNPSRAFAWAPIDASFVTPDTMKFTFTLNLWYAIGLAAHLEVALKLVDGEWKVGDLGTLETEKMDGLPGYNGLRIQDPLKL